VNKIFVHDQLIRFSHCDPAGIVYFPRFFDLAHSTMEDWFADGLGQPLPDLRDNLVAMIQEARRTRAQVVLTGMRIPPNYGPDYTKKFQAVFTEVARAERVPLVPFLLEGFASQREMFQSDGIHPNEQAQRLILANVWELLAPKLHKAVRPG